MKDFGKFGNLGKFCEDDFEDEWEAREAKAEYLPERYRDKEFIASGALKNVYKVFDRKMTRDVALAELKEEIPEEQYEDFFNEASLTSSLRHPNIITVYDFGFNEVHIPYFTMELKVGDTLSDILKKEQKSLDELLEIFIKVCDAISYSHSQGVLHLDLKPDNIQVGEFGEVQVCDWGLSRKSGNAKTGDLIKGTPGFMAPEQILPGEELSTLTDIFSLGGILYAILTGKLPLEGGCNTVISATVVEGIQAPLLRCPDKSIPTSLNAVVCKAMANKKEERYQRVEELKNEVTKFLLGQSTEAENAGFIKELSLFVQRNKQVCILSFISLVAFISGTLIFLVEIQKSKAQTEEAFERLERAYGERHELNVELLRRELDYAEALMRYPLFFSSPRNNLEKSLKILKSQYNPEDSDLKILNLIVLNLFLSQKYEEMGSYNSEKYRPLHEIAQRSKDLERTNMGVLSSMNFQKVLREINALPEEQKKIKRQVMERSLCYMVDISGREVVSSGIVRELLKCWNPDWDESKFIYRKSQDQLIISGINLTKLVANDKSSSGESFLRFMRFDLLDLKNSGIQSLSQIKGLPVKTIDIRDTLINNLHPHNATMDLKEVYLQKGQFSVESENKIPKHVRLIYFD